MSCSGTRDSWRLSSLRRRGTCIARLVAKCRRIADDGRHHVAANSTPRSRRSGRALMARSTRPVPGPREARPGPRTASRALTRGMSSTGARSRASRSPSR
jgi:hypothetical protein